MRRSILADITNPLRSSAERFGDQAALIDKRHQLTYHEHWVAVCSTVERLQEAGVSSGDIVVIRAETGIEYIVLLHAVWSLGAIAAPFNLRAPVPAESSLQVTDDASLGRWSSAVPLAEMVSRNDDRAQSDLAESAIDLDQTATLLSTSGSSGEPKWVQHRYANHYFSALGSNENIRLQPGDRWLLNLPLYHVSGLSIIFRAMLAGAAVAIAPREQTLSHTIRQFGITHLSLVHTQLKRLLEEDPEEVVIRNLRAVLVGGSAIPAGMIKRAHAAGLPLFTTYGSTEMASQVTTTRPGDSLDRLLTSGCPLPHREVRVADDGEILVRGRIRFDGYRRRGALLKPFDSGGWFHTGDIGEIDSLGYLSVHGRKDRMFISGGENVYPEDIERALLELDEIVLAVVVPINDEEWGRRPAAAIGFTDSPLNENELRATLAGKLPGYLIPDEFYLWDGRVADAKPSPVEVSRLLSQNRLARVSPGS